jgi:hypothetical protein
MDTPDGSIQHQKIKCSIPAGVLLLLLGSILLIDSAFGGDCLEPPPIATEQNIRDAVLGYKTFTSGLLSDMDLNQDGQVDVADLVCLVTTQSPGTPVASFDQVSSTVREGASAAGIQVNFSSRFVGDLKYTIDGSAVAGLDYSSLSGTVAVDGVAVYIPVAVVDDNENEANVETILLTLSYTDGGGQGYVPGIFTEHCVYVHDNDAVWSGSMQILSMDLHFQMRIIQDPAGTDGALVTDGYGIIPLNGASTEWPVNAISLDESRFDAEVTGITIPAGSTQTDAGLERRLVFFADKSNPEHVVNPDSEIRGQVTEYLKSDSHPQFNRLNIGGENRGIKGKFILLKKIDVVEPQQPVLQDVN